MCMVDLLLQLVILFFCCIHTYIKESIKTNVYSVLWLELVLSVYFMQKNYCELKQIWRQSIEKLIYVHITQKTYEFSFIGLTIECNGANEVDIYIFSLS